MIIGLCYLAVGCFLFWIGYQHWKFRREETVGALEAAILKAANEEPQKLSKLDWILKYFQAIMGFILGPIFAAFGVIIVLNELDLL
ncbi:hypothetical protein P7228_09240 [Altererythrobacter arenosus]|uniref:Uncharacterized protein n=1 Tax=Altererythrobacter arenosus TaxID=3032592 RepID=A0ABY8FMD1_9SPHN|nr:hypothetical protein [Altererythrobacter sp. CAU 1644]WFL76184.1 hypothetical protein P7228_09240 [Altererythrobacter sp. CAU 1644]